MHPQVTFATNVRVLKNLICGAARCGRPFHLRNSAVQSFSSNRQSCDIIYCPLSSAASSVPLSRMNLWKHRSRLRSRWTARSITVAASTGDQVLRRSLREPAGASSDLLRRRDMRRVPARRRCTRNGWVDRCRSTPLFSSIAPDGTTARRGGDDGFTRTARRWSRISE